MKRQVDFYLLNGADFSDGYSFVCQLTEKVYSQGHSLWIRLTSLVETKIFDELLWTFQSNSFIPHHFLNTVEPILIVISNSKQEVNSAPLWLNISLEIFPAGNYTRLLQIVPNQPNLLQIARDHFRHYQKLGYQTRTHKIYNKLGRRWAFQATT